MKNIKWTVLAAILVVAGCATPMELVPTGGSRADGTVNLSYRYNIFQAPKINMVQATNSAMLTCKGWGYSGAQPFGAQNSKCTAVNGYGNCMAYQVTMPYQCTGSPSASH